jgi:hypothetical protein
LEEDKMTTLTSNLHYELAENDKNSGKCTHVQFFVKDKMITMGFNVPISKYNIEEMKKFKSFDTSECRIGKLFNALRRDGSGGTRYAYFIIMESQYGESYFDMPVSDVDLYGIIDTLIDLS